jgi:hypothetical protein
MRQLGRMSAILAVVGLAALLALAPQTMAQWGYGVDKARQAIGKGKQESPKSPDGGPHNVAGEDVGGKGLASATTFKNKVRPFSYTIPAGWRQEGSGDPAGERAQFMKPGTTAGFTFHFTQMVPSFPRQASVEASFKQAKEEMSIGKYISVKRRDQGQVIGWETIESPTKGSGGFQRIQWQCYDGQNFYYSFIAHSDPRQFEQHRAALQGIINSIAFGR